MVDLNNQNRPEFEINPDLAEDADRLRTMIDNSKRMVAFTGAGISAESGIPTYRGAGGMWTKYDPEKYASIDYFRRDPTYYWRFFRDVRHDNIIRARPNLAHLALAELERRGKLTAVITQNIDGVHQKAESRRILELHGNTTRFYCVGCRESYDFDTVWKILETQLPPLCSKCSDVLRPDVVLYGEMLPPDTVMQAENEVALCDLMIVIGSSLVVYPAANMPYQAKLAGANLAIINIDPTGLDSLADLVIHKPAGNLLAQAVWD